MALLLLGFSLLLFFGTSIHFLADKGVACSTCHVTRQQFKTWQSSAHREVSCLACHKDSGYLTLLTQQVRSIKNFTSWFFSSYTEPVTAQIKNENCLACHDHQVKGTILSKGIRVSHKEFSAYNCTNCHGSVAHEIKGRARKYPDMDSCAGCHNLAEGDVECEKCHPVKVEVEKLSHKGPWSITHGPNWKKQHGMGNPKTCPTCHDENFCVICHNTEVPHTQPWSYLHPAAAKQGTEPCYRCHRKNYCMDCHRIQMPHPDNFVKQHEFVVEEKGYDVCWRCHEQPACISCHIRAAHTNVPWRKFVPEK